MVTAIQQAASGEVELVTAFRHLIVVNSVSSAAIYFLPFSTLPTFASNHLDIITVNYSKR